MNNATSTTSFQESQKFTQWWIWLLIIGLTLLFAYGLYQQLFLNQPFGNIPLPDIGLLVCFCFMLFLSIFFFLIKLQTRIDANGVQMHYYPFSKKQFNWSDIASAEVVDYGFVGGWGLRYSVKYGTVYNISGKKGLALVLKNGQKICIGTQREAEIQAVIENYQF